MEMLYKVIPNHDMVHKIHDIVNQQWLRQRVVDVTHALYDCILMGGVDRYTQIATYNPYSNPIIVAGLLQQLQEFGSGMMETNTVYYVSQWVAKFTQVHAYHEGRHVPHIEEVMERISEMIGIDPYESTSDDEE